MTISFVIPVYNEEKHIKKNIQRIFDILDNETKFEIIAVDNGSTDKSAEIIKSFNKVTLISSPNKVTVSKARNMGWQIAQYKVIVFIDGDILITKEWWIELLNNLDDLQSNSIQLSGYRYDLAEKPGWIEKSWFKSLQNSEPSYINSGNLITTIDLLKKINGFNEELISGEDVDFSQRAVKAGANLNIKPNYIVHHEGYPNTIQQFFKREQWHGIGDLKSLKTFVSSKVAISSFLTTFLILSSIISLTYDYKLSLICLVSYFLINLLMVFFRFKKIAIYTLPSLLFLQAIYSLARTMSFVKRKTI